MITMWQILTRDEEGPWRQGDCTFDEAEALKLRDIAQPHHAGVRLISFQVNLTKELSGVMDLRPGIFTVKSG